MRFLPVCLATIALAGSATAARSAPYTRASALEAAGEAALAYWGIPACGTPQLRPTALPGTTIGYTFVSANPADDPCYSEIANWVIDQAPDGPRAFYLLCQDVAHEIGHLSLPGDYFKSDPSDPSESLDPNNIMFRWMGSQGRPEPTTPQCFHAVSHSFAFQHAIVTVRMRFYRRSRECVTTLRKNGRRVGLQAWACELTDAVSP